MKIKHLFLAIVAPLSLCAVSCDDTPTTLSVISYNMRQGYADDGENSWERRSPATKLMLEEYRPDIFGVQEAHGFQVDYITENVPTYQHVGVGRDDGKEKGEKMAIFWNPEKISLEDWGTFWLSDTPEVPSKGWDAACIRSATWALMKENASGRHFYYVNTHLDHVGKLARKNGLAMIVDKIKEINPEGYPMVLTGDFNVKPDNEALKDLDQVMKSARDYALQSDTIRSFNGWGKSNRTLDYIYYSGFAECTRFETITKTFGDIPYISDHYPLISTLVFE